jgi:uncharacterized protein YkwD
MQFFGLLAFRSRGAVPCSATGGSDLRGAATATVRAARARSCGVANLCLVTATLGALLISAPGTARAADAGNDRSGAQMMVTLTNRLRASLGETSLTMREDLISLACDWADQVETSRDVSHSPFIFDRGLMTSRVGHNWSLAGENVGSGPDVYLIHGALVGSPAHYRNLVDAEFAYVGICVRHDSDGNLYVVEEFLSPKAARAHKTKH